MTATLRPPVVDANGASGGGAGDGRAEHRRLVWHALALGAVLLIAGLVVGVEGMVSADEGAVLGQARVVAATGEYGQPYWAASWDPEGRFFPVHLAERHGDRWHLFTKKPLYVEMVAAADGIAGRFGVLLLHVAGVVGAAAAAALVARRWSRAGDAVVLWATGLLSPLALDATWVIAHAPAAAASGVAAVGLARWWTTSNRRGLAFVAAGLAVGILLRHEVTLLGLAVVVASVTFATHAAVRRRAVGATAAAFGGTVLGVVGSTMWQRSVEGGSSAGLYRIRDQMGWWAARSEALWNTLASPDAGQGATGWLVLGAALLVGAAWSRAVRSRGRWTSVLMGTVLTLLVVRLVIGGSLVAGLLSAWPVGVAGLVVGVLPSAVRRRRGDLRSLLGRTCLLFGLAVLATTYAAGGTGDWGGRYLHVAAPLAVPVVVAALAGVVGERPALRGAIRPLAACAAVLLLIGVAAFHRASTTSLLAVEAVRAFEEPSVLDRDPIFVTTSPLLGRWLVGTSPSGSVPRLLFVDPDGDVGAQARAILAAFPPAAGSFAVVAPGPDARTLQAALRGRTVGCPSAGLVPLGTSWRTAVPCRTGSGT